MARYLNQSDVYNLLGERGMTTVHCSQIDVLPTADVAPRAEVAREIFEEIRDLIRFTMEPYSTTLYAKIEFEKLEALKKKYTEEK